jgi:putative Mg2+ transporter-C (MgtC) family protein
MMPLHPTWEDICLRLLLTVIAGAMLGFDREARGHAAGLRTTILVALAASVAMIQTNILLPLEGKDQGSFAVMDMMRLPLGILTGVGFLGGGAILKRGGSISGVTTAATLWIATVIGLSFGGGQLGLGVIATGLAILTLWDEPPALWRCRPGDRARWWRLNWTPFVRPRRVELKV